MGPEGFGAEQQSGHDDELRRELPFGEEDLTQPPPDRVSRGVVVIPTELRRTMTQHHQRMTRQSGLGGPSPGLRTGTAERVRLADVLGG